MANPAPTINQINAFNATQGTTIDFNIIGGTELVRSNRIYIYDLSDNSLICTHLYVSTESIHELPPNTDGSMVYESGKSSADFVNGAQYYAQIQTFTDIAGTEGGSGLSVAKMFWCLVDPTLTITTIPSTISTTSYNVSATYNANTSVVSNIIQQYQFSLYSATGSLLQSSGVVVGSGEQQGTSTAYDISYNFSGLSVGSSYYVVVDVTTTQGMSVTTQSNTFTVSIDTPTLGEATVVNNACDGYISVTSNLSSEYGGSGSGEIVSFETDSENVFTKLQVDLEPVQDGTPWQGTDIDREPYQFRAMPQQSNDYNREYNTIVGGSVAWNQLINIANGSRTDRGVTASLNTSTGVITLSGTTSTTYSACLDPLPAISGHKYIRFMRVLTNPNNVSFDIRPFNVGWTQGIDICNSNDTINSSLGIINVTANTSMEGITLYVNIIDLTQLFGSSIADYIYTLEQGQAGAGVAFFRKYFPKSYYPYDAGTIKSVEGVSAHKTVGFNQWDEEWRNGYFNQWGTFYSNASYMASKNYIPVVPNTTYNFHVGSKNAGRICFYDLNEECITTQVYTSSATDFTFTTPNNCYFMQFDMAGAYGNTYKNDICINLSWDGERNGEYESYVEHSYPLDDSLTLRGIPKIANGKLYYDGDTYESDGTVTRKYGIVDLGTLTYSYNSTYGTMIAVFPDDSQSVTSVGVNGICGLYVSHIGASLSTLGNKEFLLNSTQISSGKRIAIKDSAYTDATTFKSAMSGVYLVYELATPTTETADTFVNPQIVDDFGTEEYITTSIVPVGHESRYALVCPISGHDDVDVGVVGKNLFDIANATQAYIDGNGMLVANVSFRASDFILINPNQAYTLSYIRGQGASGSGMRIAWYDENKDFIRRDGILESVTGLCQTTATAPSNASYGRVSIYFDNSYVYAKDQQFEKGTTATSYEPYTAETIHQEIEVTYTPTVQENEPYQFKRTGDVGGDRESIELVGGTVAWNQLVRNGNFQNTDNWSTNLGTGTGTLSAQNNELTYTVTSVGSSYWDNGIGHYFLNEIPAGHIIYISGEVNPPHDGTITLGIRHNSVGVSGAGVTKSAQANVWNKYERVTVSQSTSITDIAFMLYASDNGYAVGDKCKFRNVHVTDLTAFFANSSIASYVNSLADNIAWLRKYYPKLLTYNPYNVGELISVNASSHDTVGFNQWDEEWVNGTWQQNGTISSTQNVSCKNPIRVFPNTTYYFYCGSYPTVGGYGVADVSLFDENMKFIAYSPTGGYTGKYTFAIHTTDNTRYIVFTTYASQYGNVYKNDICINISDPTKNGTYEPYVKNTYPLDSSITLRGLPKVANGKLYYDGDTYRSDGLHTERYKLIDLGSLNWEKNGNVPQYFATLPVGAVERSENAMASSRYSVSANGAYDGNIDKSFTFMGTVTPRIWIRDSDYNTSSALKTALSGIYLLYPRATSTTSYAESFENIQKVTPNYGTEEFVTTTNVPVGNNTQYLTRDIYGGYIDLVSGELVVTHEITLMDSTWNWIMFPFSVSGGITAHQFYVDNKISLPAERREILCNAFKPILIADREHYNMSAYLSSSGYCFRYDDMASVDDWKAFITTNEIFVYHELATPLTYQLTPQQIQTLVGVNNVWSEQGNVELSYHIPITNLLVKRQDVDDVSGDWLTLYSQPVSQASDMDFTFIDFTNQYGKTYKYALVPLLTQTQSGVEVEVEGGYTVSDEVQSVFDGVFIADSTGSQKCKANVGYGNVDMNQVVGSITPIGAKYPIIITNSQNQYHNGSISGTIVPDDYYFNGNLSRVDMVNKRNELEQFLTNKRAKIIKDWNGNIWLAMILDNVSCTFNNNYGMGIVNFNTNWVEVGDPTNQQDLQATGLINVGGV